MEFFILNNKGYMVNDAAKLRSIARKKHPSLQLFPEAGKNMVEISSFPSVNVLHTLVDLIEKLKALIEVADSNEYLIYPNATYPGLAKTELTNQRKFELQSILFGNDRALQATLVAGFHYHYTLPRGVFDHKLKFIKPTIKSKFAQAMIDSYNLGIALDPAITTLMQSSPFVQGKFLAKDSRMLIYRGGKKLNYFLGKYSQHQALGALPPYKQTLSDLQFSLKKRQSIWKEMMIKTGLDPRSSIRKDNILEFTWNPVRISRLGTLELRGMDMNHPKRTMAMASLLKFVFRQIYRDLYRVMPSDIGMKEPFKIEGNIIHIPPHTYVRNELQKEAAYNGFENKQVHNYTSRFFRFAKQFVDKNYYPVLRPLQQMITNKQTVSDTILKRIKKMGYGKRSKLPNEVAAECALKSCERLLEEVDATEKNLYRAYDMEMR